MGIGWNIARVLLVAVTVVATAELSKRYPRYGGDLFEKRVDSWMRNHAFHRLTWRHGSYEHRNFPRNGLRRRLQLLLERARLKPALS